VTWQRIRDGW